MCKVAVLGLGDGINYNNYLEFTLAYQPQEVGPGYLPITADMNDLVPRLNLEVVGQVETTFTSVGAVWTRFPSMYETASASFTLPPSSTSLGYVIFGGGSGNVNLAVSGTVYNTGSITLSQGTWLLSGTVTFTTTANLDATAITAGIGLFSASAVPIGVLSSVIIQSHLGGGTSYRLAIPNNVITVADFTPYTTYSNASFTAAGGNVGTVAASINCKAIRLA